MLPIFSITTDNLFFHHSYDATPKPAQYHMHTHGQCELYWFLSGRGHFCVEGSRYVLEPGDMIIMNAAESHYIDLDPDVPYERCALHFCKDFVRKVDPAGKLLVPFENRLPGRDNLLRAADFPDETYKQILNRMLRETDEHELQIISNLFPLLHEIRTAFEGRTAGSSAPKETQTQQMIRYINDNLSQPLSLDALCERFYISKSQLCRVFKHATGSTVWEYITLKRLLFAQQLMRAGTPPSQACVQCGYGDYSVFYRIYQKHFAHSPKTDYRRAE